MKNFLRLNEKLNTMNNQLNEQKKIKTSELSKDLLSVYYETYSRF